MTKHRLIDNPAIDRLLREGRMDEALRQPLHAQDVWRDRLRDFFGTPKSGETLAEGALYTSLTLGDFLYDYVRMDPRAVAGIDFARSEDLSDLVSFSRFAEDFVERYDDLSGPAIKGSMSQLQGYVAERLAGSHCQALDQDVTFPDTSNQAGWDLLVDGKRFQVKCVSSASLVQEHLERYPDIPVIVNADLADEVGHLQGVYIDAELHHEVVRDITERTLYGGAELLDFKVPWIALAVSTAMGIRDFLNRDTDLQGAITNVLTDTGGRIACGTLGEESGALIGLMLFGSAGAIVGAGVGAVTDGVIGRPLARTVRRLLTWSEENVVQSRVVELASQVVDCLPQKLEAWQTKHAVMEECFASGPPDRRAIGRYLSARLQDHMAYLANKREEIGVFTKEGIRRLDPLVAVQRLLILIKRRAVHPHQIQAPLQQVLDAAKILAQERGRYRLA